MRVSLLGTHRSCHGHAGVPPLNCTVRVRYSSVFQMSSKCSTRGSKCRCFKTLFVNIDKYPNVAVLSRKMYSTRTILYN